MSGLVVVRGGGEGGMVPMSNNQVQYCTGLWVNCYSHLYSFFFLLLLLLLASSRPPRPLTLTSLLISKFPYMKGDNLCSCRNKCQIFKVNRISPRYTNHSLSVVHILLPEVQWGKLVYKVISYFPTSLGYLSC